MEEYEHVMFIQRLKPDKKEEYIKAHQEIWPDLLKAHKEAGIAREIIWIFGDYLILYIMSTNFKEAMNNLSETKIFKEWINYMSQLLDEIQDYSLGKTNIITLEKVFDLEKQLEDLEKSN